MPVVERGLIDNNFQAFTEGLGQVAWRTFPAMFGLNDVKDIPVTGRHYSDESWLWSYGGGAVAGKCFGYLQHHLDGFGFSSDSVHHALWIILW